MKVKEIEPRGPPLIRQWRGVFTQELVLTAAIINNDEKLNMGGKVSVYAVVCWINL